MQAGLPNIHWQGEGNLAAPWQLGLHRALAYCCQASHTHRAKVGRRRPVMFCLLYPSRQEQPA